MLRQGRPASNSLFDRDDVLRAWKRLQPQGLCVVNKNVPASGEICHNLPTFMKQTDEQQATLTG